MQMNPLKFATLIFIVNFATVDTIKKNYEKAEAMTRLSGTNGVVDLEESKFKSLILTKKRNYHVLLLFTVSLPERNCAHCKDAEMAFEEAASNWRFAADFDSSLFFAKTDFDLGGMPIFQAFQVNTAPVVYFLHADGDQRDNVFLEKYGFRAEGYAEYIEKVTGIKIVIKKVHDFIPIIYSSIFFLFIFILVRYDILSWEVLTEALEMAVGVCVVLFILAMTSGFMWNHMRSAMFVYERGKEMLFFHPWVDNQLIAESFIIFTINLLVGSGIVMLSEGGRCVELAKKKAWTGMGIVVTVGAFYAMVHIFKKKYDGYPNLLLII